MKKHIIQYLMVLAAVGIVSSCQTGFEDINTDYRHPREQDLELDGLKIGGFLTAFQQYIFPVGSSGTFYVNDYQIPYTLAGACWVGYMSPAQNKWVGKGFPSYALKPWSDYVFNVMHKKSFSAYLELKKRTTDDPAALAMINIIKVASVHKATDTFGPIPYSREPEEGSIQSSYDSQEEVYRLMLKELDEAVMTLSQQAHNVLPNYDMIYGGDYTKWIKFANSLMLRLAMRVVYVEPEWAKQYAEKAVSNPFGVIEQVDDMAQLSKGAGIVLNNPLVTINGVGYNDARMGAEIYSYMKGYKDPRTEAYFTKGVQNEVRDFYPVFKSLQKVDNYLDRSKYSLLNVENETPVFIMKASEVAFLRAEGALRGWSMGGGNSAETFYKEGVALSFKENGVSDANLNAYVNNSTNLPAKVEGQKWPAVNLEPVSTITVRWDESKGFEKSLERIITQKYIALYPDGQEAWCEYRRTGYPSIFPANFISTDSNVDKRVGPTRIPYSEKEYTDNLENIKKAVELLKGKDDGATRLWWDKKAK